jgi:hypothetical protein
MEQSDKNIRIVAEMPGVSDVIVRFDRDRTGDSEELYDACVGAWYDVGLMKNIIFNNDRLGFPPAVTFIKAYGFTSREPEELAYICAFWDAFFTDNPLQYRQSREIPTDIPGLAAAKVYEKPAHELLFVRGYDELRLLKELSPLIKPLYWELYPGELSFAAAALLDATCAADSAERIARLARAISREMAREVLTDEQCAQMAQMIYTRRRHRDERIFADTNAPSERLLYKGIFWILQDFPSAIGDASTGGLFVLPYKAQCDENGNATDRDTCYNSRKGNSFTHKRTWEALTRELPREIRSKPWNYYPRGRVEIAHRQATVYHNPQLTELRDFEDAVIKEFGLARFTVCFKPDHSAHYRCLSDE